MSSGGNIHVANTSLYATLYDIKNNTNTIMDDKLRQELRTKEISEMKNPTILMNENDFEVFKKEIESKTTVVVGDNPTYEDVPIKTSNIIQSGDIVVYDDVSPNWL